MPDPSFVKNFRLRRELRRDETPGQVGFAGEFEQVALPKGGMRIRALRARCAVQRRATLEEVFRASHGWRGTTSRYTLSQRLVP